MFNPFAFLSRRTETPHIGATPNDGGTVFTSLNGDGDDPKRVVASSNTAAMRRARALLDDRIGRSRKGAMFTEIVTITPEMAEAMLAHNEANRHVRRTRVVELAKIMSDGRWQLTHQGVAFSPTGRLLDGQHRLTAVIESRATVKMMVTFGAPEITFTAIDTGGARTTGDILTIRGHANSASLGHALRVIRFLEARDRTGELLTTIGNDLLDEELAKHPGLTDSVSVMQVVGQRLRISTGALAVAHWYITRRYTGEPVSEFFYRVQTGIDLHSTRDPIYVLRRYIDTDYRDLRAILWRSASLVGSTINAWNAHRAGRTVRSVTWTCAEGGALPSVE